MAAPTLEQPKIDIKTSEGKTIEGRTLELKNPKSIKIEDYEIS